MNPTAPEIIITASWTELRAEEEAERLALLALPVSPTRLPRVATVEQWLAGAARRRALCVALNGPAPIRRAAGGDPEKDAVLRRLHGGQRGPRFASMEEMEAQATTLAASAPVRFVGAAFWEEVAAAKGRRRQELAAMDPQQAQALASAAPAPGTTRLVVPARYVTLGLTAYGQSDPTDAD